MSPSTIGTLGGKPARSSFSSQVKQECAHVPIKRDCCVRAELLGWALLGGALGLSGRGIRLQIACETPEIAARLLSCIKRLYGVSAELLEVDKARLNKRHQLRVQLSGPEAQQVLFSLALLTPTEGGSIALNSQLDQRIVQKDCCKRSFLRGAFLGSGSIADPDKAYHQEFVVQREEIADQLKAIENSFQLNAKRVVRKEKHVVYLKEGESISDLMGLIGAHNCMLEFENIRVVKDMRNHINRTVNCETANSAKVARSSTRQLDCIRRLSQAGQLSQLPKTLQEIAYLRMDYPDATLEELGQLLTPPVTKSGVNHRLRRIERIAADQALGKSF